MRLRSRRARLAIAGALAVGVSGVVAISTGVAAIGGGQPPPGTGSSPGPTDYRPGPEQPPPGTGSKPPVATTFELGTQPANPSPDLDPGPPVQLAEQSEEDSGATHPPTP